MNMEKRQRTQRIELLIQERIKMLGEKEIYKYKVILKTDTIKQVMIIEIRKYYHRRTIKLIWSRNLKKKE